MKHGMNLRGNQKKTGMIIKMIGRIAVSKALKYSVVPVSFTIPKLMMKQSRERNTLAVCPTVCTGSKMTSRDSGKASEKEAAVVMIEM